MGRTMIPDEFGKKIGGSRRDQWKERGLSVSDMKLMNDAEQDKYCQKKYIWETPDYQKMLEDGVDREVLFFIKAVKDTVATKPARKEDREGYVNEVCSIRDEIMGYRTWKQCETFCMKYIVMPKRVDRDGYVYSCTPAFRSINGSKIYQATRHISRTSVEREIRRKEFLYTDYEKFTKDFRNYSKNGIELTEERGLPYIKGSGFTCLAQGLTKEIFDAIPEDGTLVINHGRYITGGSKEDAGNSIQALYEASLELNRDKDGNSQDKARKQRFVPPALIQCRREKYGSDTRTKTGKTPEDILERFSFRGGEFGNWLNEETRQENLNYAFDAFCDLAEALNIGRDQVSLNGRLSIAFGARGKGSAAAHYEPMREVINLTKFSGAGSLAHEYGHALDDILAKEDGQNGPFTGNARNCEAMKELLKTMKYHEAEVTIRKEEKDNTKNDVRCMRYYLNDEFCHRNYTNMDRMDAWLEENVLRVKKEEIYNKAGEENMEPGAYAFRLAYHELKERLSALKRELIPRAKKLSSSFMANFSRYAYDYLSFQILPEEQTVKRQTYTDFYNGSKKFDETHSKADKGYWSSEIEMFARAFSCYVKDKLREKGMVNDYLCGHSDSFTLKEDGKMYRAYPVGEERIRINTAIDRLLDELKGKGLLKEPAEKEAEEPEYLPWGELTKWLSA